MPTFAAGTTGLLDAIYQDGTGTAVVPTTPLVDIIDPDGVTVVNGAVPTATAQVGRYEYAFAVPLTPLGSWTATWTGIINGANVESSEVFRVVAAGDISFDDQPTASTCDPWATIADVCSPCDDYEFDLTVLEDSLQVASDVLFNLTGRQWPGECTTTVRPVTCGCPSSATCGCRRLSELDLPGHVVSVGWVKIDGAVVSASRYRVDDHRRLVYLPESDDAERQGWPRCQRLDRADTEADTWAVTYTHGMGPPPGGVRAAASLGCQLALACQPESVQGGKCRLPKRVTTITRQGVSIAVLDPLTLFADGLTGLAEVDLWVQSVLLGAKRRRASVWVPGQATQTIRRVGT